jgi:DNA-binding MarR family transcriptional regulator
MQMRSKKQTRQGFAYDALDSVIHERARLSVLTSLMTHPKGLAFADLKSTCALTDGNLSRHLQVLRAAKLIEITKDLDGNRPHTFCRITSNGRKRYLEYLTVLERVIRDVVAGEQIDAAGDGAQVPA